MKISTISKIGNLYVVENYKKYNVSNYMNNGLVINATEIANYINSFIEEYMISNPKLIFAMPNKDYNFIQTKIFQIPTLSKKEEMNSAIKIEVEDHYQYDKNETTLDWGILSKKFNNNSLIYSSSCSNEIKANYNKLLSELNLPSAFIPKNILLNSIVDTTSKTTLLLDIGYNHTDFIVYHNNMPLLVKTSPIAGRSISDIISSFKGTDIIEAENLKVQEGVILSNDYSFDYPKDSLELSSIIDTQLQILIDDMKRIKEQILVDYNLDINNILIYGGSSNLKYLPQYIENKLKISCDILSPSILEENNDLVLKEDSIEFINSFAASMTKYNKPLLNIIILDKKIIDNSLKLICISSSIFITLLIASLVTMGTIVSNTHYFNTSKKLDSVKNSFAEFNNEVSQYIAEMDLLNSESQQISDMINTINTIDDIEILPAEVIKLIKSHTPNKIQLDTIKLLGTNISLEGVASNYMDLGYYVKELETIDSFSNIKFEYEDVLSNVSGNLQIKNLKFKIDIIYRK